MKVVKLGNETDVNCPNCKSTLRYISADIRTIFNSAGYKEWCVSCPICGTSIKINYSKENNRT